MAQGASATTAPGICVTIDRKDGYDDDDMKVVEATSGRLKAIGKRIGRGRQRANRSGCWRSAPAAPSASARRSSRRCAPAEGTTIWYLRVIHHLAQNGDVWTLDINGEEWGEVDFPARRRGRPRTYGALEQSKDRSRGLT